MEGEKPPEARAEKEPRSEYPVREIAGPIFPSVFSAASFVAAVFLFTYCVPASVMGGSVGCVVPHELAVTGFAILGAFFLVLFFLQAWWAGGWLN
ncbi:MAG: hypothetical protein ACREDE_11115 [Thermoplasmata archaeon]